MLEIIDKTIWPITILIMVVLVLKYFYQKSQFKENLSDILIRLRASESNLNSKITENDAKIKTINKTLSEHQNDLTQFKIQRGLSG